MVTVLGVLKGKLKRERSKLQMAGLSRGGEEQRDEEVKEDDGGKGVEKGEEAG